MNSYYMNVQCVNGDWAGSKILRYKFITSPSEDRFHTPASNVIYDGGWHMNFLGGAEAIKTKIKSFAHQEYNAPGILNGIEQRLAGLHDVLGRPDGYRVIPIDDKMPKYVLENMDKFESICMFLEPDEHIIVMEDVVYPFSLDDLKRLEDAGIKTLYATASINWDEFIKKVHLH